jgi:hypothetical protein
LKSILLRPLDRFMRNKKENAGADVPIKLTGTMDALQVGLNLGRRNARSGAE